MSLAGDLRTCLFFVSASGSGAGPSGECLVGGNPDRLLAGRLDVRLPSGVRLGGAGEHRKRLLVDFANTIT